MKIVFKWFLMLGVLILTTVCIDINFNGFRTQTIKGNQLMILNLATSAILLILIFRFFIIRNLHKKKR
jgi:hypothetical protein